MPKVNSSVYFFSFTVIEVTFGRKVGLLLKHLILVVNVDYKDYLKFVKESKCVRSTRALGIKCGLTVFLN